MIACLNNDVVIDEMESILFSEKGVCYQDYQCCCIYLHF